jgi:hypothetical protein
MNPDARLALPRAIAGAKDLIAAVQDCGIFTPLLETERSYRYS